MKSFNISQGSFESDGKKTFLCSGEIHYFRISRELWDVHLDAACEAGIQTVSSYVPWAWHEHEEGLFDFTGKTHPERDLKTWLLKCKERRLTCILKPGPFILAEFRGAGLPDWFMDRYGNEVKMRTRNGEVVASDGVNLFSKAFRDKTAKWYAEIMPLIAENQVSKGGPVIMMQVCNEIGVFSWLAHQADYGGDVKERFIAWLREQYQSLEIINRVWGTSYKSHEAIELPPDGKAAYFSPEDKARDYDWHRFWRYYYAVYLKELSLEAGKYGIELPVYHNLPGWIYGQGYEFPVNITMYDELYGDKSKIIFGVDHIPEFMSHRNMHDDRIINDITRAMQGNKPLFAAEFQCGSREYHVVTNPREMELFYKASLANGLKGWNYYMFSQGKNPPRKGYSGDTFYWFTPLTASGQRTSAFPLVKRINRLVAASEDLIVHSERKADVCVLFYPPYYATELERAVDKASRLVFNPSAIRRPAWFDGLLKALQLLNVDYDMLDLSRCSPEMLKPYRQVWAFCTDQMDAPHQQVLADYALKGGNLILFPYLPDREMSMKPCTILRDALAVKPSGLEYIDSPLIDVYGLKDIKCSNPQVVYNEKELSDALIIARNLNGSVCGFTKATGKGAVTHLGTWIGFDTEGHKPVYLALLRKSQARLHRASASTDNISVRQRFDNHGSGILFAGNYYNEEQYGHISYTHPENGEPVNIPFTRPDMIWPPLYAFVSPVNLKLKKGLKLLHTTSDLLEIKHKKTSIELVLYGERDLYGEIVLEVEGDGIRSAQAGGTQLRMIRTGNRQAFAYDHPHQKEFFVSLEF